MALVPEEEKLIQVEDIEERAPFSEAMIQKIAGSINWIFSNLNASVLGQIKISDLTEAQYQTIHGTGFILADGRDVTGSDYAVLTGNTLVPDFRGIYYRMKDNGRGIATEIAPGGFQAGIPGSPHIHRYSFDKNLASLSLLKRDEVGGGGSTDIVGVQFSPIVATITIPLSVTGAGGGVEDRPRNITTNFFIRIN